MFPLFLFFSIPSSSVVTVFRYVSWLSLFPGASAVSDCSGLKVLQSVAALYHADVDTSQDGSEKTCWRSH